MTVRSLSFWNWHEENVDVSNDVYTPQTWSDSNQQLSDRALILAALYANPDLVDLALPALPENHGRLILQAVAQQPLRMIQLSNLDEGASPYAYEITLREVLELLQQLPALQCLELTAITEAETINVFPSAHRSLTRVSLRSMIFTDDSFRTFWQNLADCPIVTVKLDNVSGLLPSALRHLAPFASTLLELHLAGIFEFINTPRIKLTKTLSHLVNLRILAVSYLSIHWEDFFAPAGIASRLATLDLLEDEGTLTWGLRKRVVSWIRRGSTCKRKLFLDRQAMSAACHTAITVRRPLVIRRFGTN